MIVVRVKVSRGIESFSPMGINSADTSQPPNGEIRMDQSHLLLNNLARQSFRYTSVPLEEAELRKKEEKFSLMYPIIYIKLSRKKASEGLAR